MYLVRGDHNCNIVHNTFELLRIARIQKVHVTKHEWHLPTVIAWCPRVLIRARHLRARVQVQVTVEVTATVGL